MIEKRHQSCSCSMPVTSVLSVNQWQKICERKGKQMKSVVPSYISQRCSRLLTFYQNEEAVITVIHPRSNPSTEKLLGPFSLSSELYLGKWSLEAKIKACLPPRHRARCTAPNTLLRWELARWGEIGGTNSPILCHMSRLYMYAFSFS